MRYLDEHLRNDMGLTRLKVRTRALRGRRDDLEREPSAGNPHAGFYERGEETPLKWGGMHR